MQVSVQIPAPTALDQTLAELHRCKSLSHAKQVHAQILKANLHNHRSVASKLISAFSNCRQIAMAVTVFDQFQNPDALLYNTLIRAHAQNSPSSLAFAVFFQMQGFGISPDNFTYPFLLKACYGKLWLSTVEMIHAHILKFGFCCDVFVPNSLIDCYSKCGFLGISSAMKLFRSMGERDVVSWNTMIGGLVQSGRLGDARNLFDEMPRRDSVSWNTMLDGYTKAGAMNYAFELFERMPRRTVVSWSTMVSGYSKAGDMDMARMIFDKMPEKNLVAWTIMVSGYAEKGLAEEAVRLYDQMEEAGLIPDDGTVISILGACSQPELLDLGKRVHGSIRNLGIECSTRESNALVNMYAKCGSLAMASTVFNGMVEKDLMSWNAMLHGLAMHGRHDKALQLLSTMKQEGFEPNRSTFSFTGCNNAGLVEDSLRHFSAMQRDFGIVPETEHYSYMINLLGCTDRLRDAYRLVRSAPVKPNAIIWSTLLGACRMHNAFALAEEVIDHLAKIERFDSAKSSNVNTSLRDWDNAGAARLQVNGKEKQRANCAGMEDSDDEVAGSDRSERLDRMIDSLRQNLKRNRRK